jgi:hypothetical protein
MLCPGTVGANFTRLYGRNKEGGHWVLCTFCTITFSQIQNVQHLMDACKKLQMAEDLNITAYMCFMDLDKAKLTLRDTIN